MKGRYRRPPTVLASEAARVQTTARAGATWRCAGPPPPSQRLGDRLLHREDVRRPDVRVPGQQVAGDLTEGRGDPAVQVCLPAVLVREGVEDAVGGVTDPERVPGDRLALLGGELAALAEEVGELVALAGLGLEQRKQPTIDSHVCHLSS